MNISKTNPNDVAPPIGHYSHAVRVETGDCAWIYISGQVALDEDGELVGPDDLAAQTEQVFENLLRVLRANGATFEDVVKVQSYVTTLEGMAESREVRRRYLPTEPPASTAVRIAELLLPGALIEVDVVAVVAA